jgi:beta-N-acetylhexosaminidase
VKANTISVINVLLLAFLLVLMVVGCKTVTEPPEVTPEEPVDIEIEDGEGHVPYIGSDQDLIESRVNEVMEHMSLRQKIGQRFITWVPGTDFSEETRELLLKGQPAGIILYKWNYESLEGVQVLTESIQEYAKSGDAGIQLFVCADQEGGRVAAFRFSELALLPAAYHWTVYGNYEYVKAAAYINGVQLRYLGCNMNLAPVLDLYDTPDSSIIGDRSFGGDAGRVSWVVKAYLEGISAAHVIPVAKHFPGHGVSKVDSHGSLPVTDILERDLLGRELLPYVSAIENGLDAIMTAHILYRQIDPDYPATLSKTILNGMLRNKLGFNGVVISDGLEMGALSNNYTLDDTILLAFQAGVDLVLLYTRYDLIEVIDIVEGLIQSGRLQEEEIDEGVKRVLRLKLKYGLL